MPGASAVFRSRRRTLVAIDIFFFKCYYGNYLIVIPLFFFVILGKSLGFLPWAKRRRCKFPVNNSKNSGVIRERPSVSVWIHYYLVG